MNGTPGATVYLENVEQDIERLLSSMDRNAGSETFGCLSRPYWHDKVTDFPSAHQQIGVLPLALAYTMDRDGNPFYGDDRIRTYVDGALRFWSGMRNRNGSFDEHYPNEHSLGAAAWTLWAATEAYLLLDDPPGIEDAVVDVAGFLQRFDEKGAIANHQAVAAAALANADRIAGTGMQPVRRRVERVAEMQHGDGWFREYLGADIGYQSTTIAHLARVRDVAPDLVDRDVVERALDFFSDFIDADNHYAGIIGSRNTAHVHASGFERLAEDFPAAERIAGAVRRNREAGRLLDPVQMDDKHFSRQLAEYMDAARVGGEVGDGACTAVRERDYDGISIRERGDVRLYVNVSKGGVFKRYRDGELVERDTGIAVRKDGQLYTGNWPGVADRVKRSSDRIRVEGQLRAVPRNTLDGHRFLLSRLFAHTLGRLPRLSLAAKDLLISRLIRSDSGGVPFTRDIAVGEAVEVADGVEGERVDGDVRANFVPSSEFFAREHLHEEGDGSGGG